VKKMYVFARVPCFPTPVVSRSTSWPIISSMASSDSDRLW
jgi:hypothetical protein